MILDRELRLIKILVHEVSPSPLTIVAIAQGTGTHGRVSHQEEYRIVPPPDDCFRLWDAP